MGIRTSFNAGLGVPNLNLLDTDAVAKYPIGTIVRGWDDVLNIENEYIYLPGVAATVANDVVVYDLAPAGPTTTRLVNNAQNNSGRPVAVALAASVATMYGWYQISGLATVNATAASAAGAMNATATAGSVNSAADAGDQIIGARLSTAVGTPSAGKAYATISRPCMQSQIT